jgi:hypothetical protein
VPRGVAAGPVILGDVVVIENLQSCAEELGTRVGPGVVQIPDHPNLVRLGAAVRIVGFV